MACLRLFELLWNKIRVNKTQHALSILNCIFYLHVVINATMHKECIKSVLT